MTGSKTTTAGRTTPEEEEIATIGAEAITKEETFRF